MEILNQPVDCFSLRPLAMLLISMAKRVAMVTGKGETNESEKFAQTS